MIAVKPVLRMMTPNFLALRDEPACPKERNTKGRLTPSFAVKIRIMARFRQPQNLINLPIAWAKGPFRQLFLECVIKMTQKKARKS
jgi:hypothetical protein